MLNEVSKRHSKNVVKKNYVKMAKKFFYHIMMTYVRSASLLQTRCTKSKTNTEAKPIGAPSVEGYDKS